MNDISRFTTITGGVDKSKEWQMELLMEKLRSKACQFKSFTETAKSVRMSMLEKRYPLDNVEKNQHQKCLDSLQHSIKVTSLQSMIERLESLTRQLGLKFMVGPSGVELFISSEMFYLEIILDPMGSVRDVKVHHEGKVEQQSCIELVNCLMLGDFTDFTTQLEGLSSIYQINAEKKIKCKAFSALQALETDLSTLAQLQTFIKEPFSLLHKSPVGILEKRKGGHAMKLTYFVSPYDLLDKDKNTSEPLTIETVTSKNLGYSVTICMEGSTVHKLQTTAIISVNRNINGKNTPSYAPLSNQNSAVLPACFVLRLNKPLPMCVSLARRIHQVTDMECSDLSSTHPIMSLITQHVSSGQLDCAHNKGLFVTLPEQHHCYFMTESKSMEGVLINSIPFAHPSHIPQILVFLRQQALFNSVVASCIRTCSKQDFEHMIMFEVSALSWQHLSVSLEHPLEESMATAEIDLTDISNVTCKIHTPTSSSSSNQACSDPASELASKVFQRCLSIPITMRSVIKLWDEQVNRKNHLNSNENFSLPLGSVDPGGHNGSMGNPLTDFGGLNSKIKHEPSNGSNNGHSLSGISLAHPHQGMFLNDTMISGTGFSPFPGSEGPVNMLNNIEINSLLSGASSLSQSNEKMKRQNKRKASEDLWKSAKRKPGEDNEMMVETSSSDSTSMSTPTSHDAASEAGIATPNSALGFHSDLELSGLDAAELINASEKIAAEYDCSGETDDLTDMEDILSITAPTKSDMKVKKIRDEKKSMLLDLVENKSLVPPSVSITPITSSQSLSTVFTGMGLERRPGIEIIPIASAPPTSLPSSITITPISSSHNKISNDERNRERKSSKNKTDDKNRLEKKRKRKKNEGPMGPPDKLPPKQDPLTKPVSVSIKPAESPPLPLVTPTSPSSMLRKFNTSPLSGKSSPSMLKPLGKTGSSASHHSPKHSPAHMTSSPKHSTLPGIPSPKSHGTSPKHPSASGTGKPSMSTLKSAANSPSSKSSDSFKIKSMTKDSSNRDREKKFSSNVFNLNNPKLKSSSVKLKQLDLSTNLELQNALQSSDSLPSPSGTMDLSKSASLNQIRNRKGSLSAVIDKLKSAQHCGSELEPVVSGNSKSGNREGRTGTLSTKTIDNKIINKIGETKNSEYMVKPSSDGMKITINKTRMKDSSKSSNISKSQSSNMGTGSPKTHTGLKPGVNSGPASKKPQQPNQKSSSTGNISSAVYGSLKNSSGSNKILSSSKSSANMGASKSLTKLSGSPKSSSSGDLNRNKDNRPRLNKSSSDKSIFSCSKNDSRRGSPTSRDERDDNERAFKLLSHTKLEQTYPSPLMMEGMIKSLDTNFQIPKLSARTGDSEKKISANKLGTNFSETTINNISRSVDTTKMYDIISKVDMSLPKYPLPLPTNTKPFENNLDQKSIRNSLVSLNSTSPLLPSPLTSNTLSYTTSSSSPKRGITTPQTNIKDLNTESAMNLVGTDLSSSIIDSSDQKMQKVKEIGTPSLNLNNTLTKEDLTSNCKMGFPISVTKAFTMPSTNFTDTPIKPLDSSTKFSSPQQKSDDKKLQPEHILKVSASKSSTSSQEAAEMLLDFSTNSISKPLMSEHLSKMNDRSLPLMSVHKNTSPLPLGPPQSYPASPSVSVHIVKSPAPSPRVNPSPHSVSPCITDDELMDEALVGLGK